MRKCIVYMFTLYFFLQNIKMYVLIGSSRRATIKFKKQSKSKVKFHKPTLSVSVEKGYGTEPKIILYESINRNLMINKDLVHRKGSQKVEY